MKTIRSYLLVFLTVFSVSNLFSQEEIRVQKTDLDCNTDTLTLQTGWNWISFPRMERYGNTAGFSETVLSRINLFPNVELNLIEDLDGDPFKDYLSTTWYGFLDDLFSTSGYKLDFTFTEPTHPEIVLYGSRLDPQTTIYVEEQQENWVGYFIEEAQYPWDAFPSGTFDNNLISIKAQDWAMFKINGQWMATSRVVPIEYGDMLILNTTGIEWFIWNNPVESEETVEYPNVEYYSFMEQSDYLPIYIETDSTSDIQEIAVLADGEVVGAAVRLPGDTLVEVNAYLEEVPTGTPLEFETWTGYKSAPVEKGSYSVKNRFNGLYEKRNIYKGERAKYHIASLKAGTVAQTPSAISNAHCSPNPFSRETLITFRLNSESYVRLSIFDQKGKLVRELMDSHMPAGYYKLAWDGTNSNGQQLENGIYFFRLKAGDDNETSGKVVLIK